MTDRLYYHDSFLYDFDAEVREVTDNPRPALILDRTAFYPTSGGQVFDTGWIHAGDAPIRAATASEAKESTFETLKVVEVAEAEDGHIILFNTGSGLKYLDVLDAGVARAPSPAKGTSRVRAGDSPAQPEQPAQPAARHIGGIIGPY